MKLYKISLLLLGALLFAACDDIDEQEPARGSLTQDQVQATNTAVTSRTDASFTGMYSLLTERYATWQNAADDFGFIMAHLCMDLEGADMTGENNDYNWFSTSSELSSRNANYRNPMIRYKVPYDVIGATNSVISSFPAETTDSASICKMAQAHALRAYAYMALAPYFQFGYATAADQPCVPLLKDDADPTNNPRATVKDVYGFIMDDLNYAVEHLAGYQRANKTYIDQNVAYGLRARANLLMGNYAEAAADAAEAMKGYTPASIAEVSVPSFCQISEHNWMWGIIYTAEMVQGSDGYRTPAAWVSSFSGDGYAPTTQTYFKINSLLYNKIPMSDVRKGWWLTEDLQSPLLADQKWGDARGQDIVDLEITDVKMKMLPYDNVKFGMKSGIGSTTNNNDWPLMRVEEMMLIEIEGLAKSGQESTARSKMENFVKTYRDPEYTIPTTRTFADEIWFQRRVELWGEGFFTSDAKRLNKPIVRFHGAGTSNFPEDWQFNIAADDGWLNMRFPQTELDNNLAIVDNEDGTQPEKGQNPTLKDGVTD